MKFRLQQILRPAPALLWLNVLSLDALLVALLWQDFFAREYRISLALSSRLLLALCAWLAYAGDRWLDGLKLSHGQAVLPRHRFAQRHRRLLALGWLAALTLAAYLAFADLPASPFKGGLFIAVLVAIYFVLYQWPATARHLRGFKEASVGILFALATVILVFPFPALGQRGIALPVAGWAAVCFLNCYGIACWEQPEDVAQRHESLATRWPGLIPWFRKVAWFSALTIGFASLLLAWRGWPSVSALRHIGFALATSCLMLGLLDWLREHTAIGKDWLRLGADLALLTPIFFL